MRWERGHAAVEHLLAEGSLELDPAARAEAKDALAEAEANLAKARARVSQGLDGRELAFEAIHGAARAVLLGQGLRGHGDDATTAVRTAAVAQFSGVAGPTVFTPLDPTATNGDGSASDFGDPFEAATWAVQFVDKLLSGGRLPLFAAPSRPA